MVVYNNILAGASGATTGAATSFKIDRSLRFNADDTAHLSRTFSVGNRKTWTWSGWVKRSKLSAEANLFSVGASSTEAKFRFNADDTLKVTDGDAGELNTNAVFRDPSAWYHIIVALDNTQSTAANRFKLYVNGVEQTYSTATYSTQNTDSDFNTAVAHYFGRQVHNTSNLFDGYLAEVHWVDGQALAPTDFGEYDDNNVWQPKEYAGTYGTNGFHLDFSDNSSNAALGTDSSGNSNNWTVNNLSVASGVGNDSLIDTPTNYEADSGNPGGNYATLNPLHHLTSATITNGNLETTSDGVAFTTILLTSGKWYVEHKVGAAAYNLCFSQPDHPSGATPSTSSSKSIGWYSNGYVYWGAGNSASPGGTTMTGLDGSGYMQNFAAGDVLGATIDMDTSTITYYKNGSSVGSIVYGTGSCHSFREGIFVTQFNGYGTWNFGQRPFAHTPPTGYKSLCTTNLPDPTIADGSTAFDTKLWTGDGSSSRAITGLDMSPDLLWVKRRNTSLDHFLWDSVRGVTKELYSNQNYAEGTATNKLASLDANGFTVKNNSAVNSSGDTYVAWAWDGGNLVTNSAYNQSRTWSDNATGGRSDEPIEDLFNGDTSTFAQNTSGNTNPNNIVVTFSPGLAYTTSVEVYPQNASSCAINNGSQTSTTNNQWNTMASGSGTLTELDFQRNATNGCSVAAIRVDGKILVNPGVIPPGGLNSSAYNTSDTWSDDLSSPNGAHSGSSVTSAFDGSLTSGFEAGNPSSDVSTIRFQPASAITVNSQIRIYVFDYNAGNVTYQYRVNDGSWSDMPGESSSPYRAWRDLGFTGSLSSFEYRSNTSITYKPTLYAVEIDGKMLINSGTSLSGLTQYPTIASTVRANTSAGFSIVSYTGNATAGATIGHDLGAVPKLVIIKSRDSGHDWIVYHSSIGNTAALRLNGTNMSDTNSKWFNNAGPSSSTFTLGYTGGTNENGDNMLALCFAPVEGYSAMGSYTGNNLSDGPFVYTGFRPAFVMAKRSSGAGDWIMHDTTRTISNGTGDNNTLVANVANSEDGYYTATQVSVDYLSNGFKLRHAGGPLNDSSQTYIYAAFAEHPFSLNGGLAR